MRKISPQRALSETINFLMALLFVIPLGVLIEQLCGFPLYRCCLIPCLAVLGHLAGRISMRRPMNIAMILCGVGAVLAAVLAFILGPGLCLCTILITLLTLFFAVFFFFTARKAGYTIYAPLTISGILLHILVLICCTGFEWESRITSFTSIIAILYFLLALYSFSAKGLRRSMHRGSGASRVTYPAGMQMGNFLLVTGFIIIAAFLSNIHPIFVIFSQAFAYVIRALVAFFALFGSLFSRRSVPIDAEAEEETSVAEDSILNAEAKGEASWITKGVEIFAFIIAVAFILYLLFKLFKKMRESGAHLPAFLRNLRDRFMPVEDEDFVDETESLLDAKTLLADTTARMKGIWKKVTDRPQKIDDFKDNRTKIRFTYQQILKRVTVRDPSAPTKTPNEVYRSEYDGEEEFRDFMDCYNAVKYGGSEVSEEEVDAARDILRQRL